MSTAILTGHRLIMLVKNVILINSGTINFSFQIQNRKWLYNKRSLKLPPCILWYFNHLMFSLSSWTSFHFAHWSNYNFFFYMSTYSPSPFLPSSNHIFLIKLSSPPLFWPLSSSVIFVKICFAINTLLHYVMPKFAFILNLACLRLVMLSEFWESYVP